LSSFLSVLFIAGGILSIFFFLNLLIC
jgi:hypothetical protein